SKLNQLGAEYSTRLLGGLAILILGIWLTRKLARLTVAFLNKTQVDSTLHVFATNTVKIVLYGLVLLAALNSVGVPMTSVVALLGTIGLAVALALKDSLNNVAAGLSLLILRPFRVGDYIEIGSTGGTVIELNFFHTVFNTSDNRRVIIPNSKAISEVITNFSRNEIRRIDMVFTVSYQADLKLAAQILKELLAADQRLLTEPEPVVAVSDLGAHGVDFVVRPWVKWDLYWAVRFDYTEKVKLAFDAAGIEIPYPQRQVHLIAPEEGLKIRLLPESQLQELPQQDSRKSVQEQP
ncbi:MAG TPA: mechanosensitive ion channel domain-containing protein, partial [Candidatus Obscuribacterales bacterium]